MKFTFETADKLLLFRWYLLFILLTFSELLIIELNKEFLKSHLNEFRGYMASGGYLNNGFDTLSFIPICSFEI